MYILLILKEKIYVTKKIRALKTKFDEHGTER